MTLASGIECQKCGALPPCTLSGWSLVEYVLFCNAFWWISYCFLVLVTRQSEEWCCRLLTFVHGCMVSFTSIRDILINKSSLTFERAPLSETQKNYLSFMLSYFLFDFCWFHVFGNEPWVIYFHHLTSILIILKIIVSEYGGAGISYAVAGLEFTNPYLQLRWFLRTHGYLNTPIHTAVELWFFGTFSLTRTIGGTILFYYAVVVCKMDLGMKISFLCIYLISLALQWQIIAYFKKKYWNKNRRNVPSSSSRVSISQYFQRKTLDRFDSRSSDLTGASAKEGSLSIKAAEAASNKGSVSVKPAQTPSIKGGDSPKVDTTSKRSTVEAEQTQSVGGGSESEQPKEE